MATDLYRRCPGPKCHYGTISEYEQGPNATHTSRCWTCNGIGFVRVDAPAPTDALRAAAQAYVAARDHQAAVFESDSLGEDWAHAQTVADKAVVDAYAALRAALDGVPAPEPVALTDEERKELAGAIRKAALFVTFADEPGRERSALERSQLGLDAVLAQLAALGITLHREAK